jgi:hypothetical protein
MASIWIEFIGKFRKKCIGTEFLMNKTLYMQGFYIQWKNSGKSCIANVSGA